MRRGQRTAGTARVPRRARPIVLGVIAGILCGIALLPVETKQGVNYQITSRRVPLAVKGMEFVLRDAAYRRLSQEITRGLSTDEARALAVFRWTQEHIRPAPRGWPAVDDHILHIIIRGYGEDDQMADVFATLSTYAGVPAFWRIVRAREGNGRAVFSFAQIDGHWTVWDVRRRLVFRNAKGALASISDLAAPGLIELTVGSLVHGDQAYQRYVEDALDVWTVPRRLRAHQQMPGPRLWLELTRLWRREDGTLGLERGVARIPASR